MNTFVVSAHVPGAHGADPGTAALVTHLARLVHQAGDDVTLLHASAGPAPITPRWTATHQEPIMMLEPESPDGAHDDVLEAAEGGRRDFLRQVLAGAAFAAPLMASFSMDGMSTEEAEGAIGPYSSYCPDLPGDTKPCCALANCIANELVQLAQRAKNKMNAATPRLPSLARAQVHNKIAVAQAELTAGMIEGDDLCSSFEARARYSEAKLALEELLDILDQIANDHGVDLELSSQVQVAINDLQQLLDSEC